MRHAPAVARILVGLMFLIVGLNGFFNFLPPPATLPAAVVTFMGGMAAAKYMLPLLAATQVIAALFLLSNRFVPLALALLAPVVLNIALFHAFVYHAGAAQASVTIVLYLIRMDVSQRISVDACHAGRRGVVVIRINPAYHIASGAAKCDS